MSTSQQVARGTLRLLVGQLSARALDFALYLLLARKLGVSEFGRYTFALSFTVLFNVLTDLGLSTVFVREISRAPERTRAMLRRALELKLGLGGLTLVATAAIAFATHAPASTCALISLFTAALLLNSSALLFEGLLKSAGRAGVAGLSLFAQSITGFAVGAMLVMNSGGAMGGAIAYLLAAIARLAVVTWTTRDLAGAPPALPAEPPLPVAERAVRTGEWRERFALLRESAPLALSSVFIAVYFRVDSVLLNSIKGAVAVGLYGSIYRLFEAFTLFSAAFRSVLFPVMARAADGPAGSLGVLCRKSLRVHLLFTVGLAAFVTCRARAILGVALGPAYAAAAPGLAVLFWALPGAFIADTLFHLLTAERRQIGATRVVSLVAVANLVMNLALIPRFSFMGAAWATAVSEALCATLLYVAFRRGARVTGMARVVAAPLVAGVTLAAAVVLTQRLVPGGAAGLAISAAIAFAAYAGTLALLRAVGPDDVRLVWEALPARGRRGATR